MPNELVEQKKTRYGAAWAGVIVLLSIVVPLVLVARVALNEVDDTHVAMWAFA